MSRVREELRGAKVFVTGGAGYVGSHAIVQLLEAGADIFAVDNFSNSSPGALKRIRSIVQRPFAFKEVDIRDYDRLVATLVEFRPDAVIHFAGLKAVGESVQKPNLYYQNNVVGSLNLLMGLDASICKTIIFSSSATVYGEARYLPIDENHPIDPANPYGRSKAIVETMIRDWVSCMSGRSGISLRYFNPVGAHVSGKIGESPNGIPNNLLPFVARVAAGELPEVQVFGNDFATRDGTGERDYIHVEDLASGHCAALKRALESPGYEAVNLGTGRGSTVLEVLEAYGEACGKPIPWRLAPRRAGDSAASVADPKKAEDLFGWRAQKTLLDACRSSCRWQEEVSTSAGVAQVY